MRGPDIEIRHINIPCHVIPLFQGFRVQEVGRSSYMCHQTTHSRDIELPDVLSDILKDFVFINFVFLHLMFFLLIFYFFICFRRAVKAVS